MSSGWDAWAGVGVVLLVGYGAFLVLEAIAQGVAAIFRRWRP